MADYLSDMHWANELRPEVVDYSNRQHYVSSGGSGSVLSRSSAECRMSAITWDAKHSSEAYRECTRINHDMQYMMDMQQYGQDEFWEGGDTRVGDCEEYAFAKLWALIQLGWPRDSFDFGVGLVEGRGHCFLIIHTDRGDKVCDSNSDHIEDWEYFRVKWIGMSRGMNLRKWVSVNA